jgi:hypothetical protein
MISNHNPNEDIGGGGCCCSETKCLDCTGPYAIFPGTETSTNLSPHTVLSLACAQEFVKRAERDGDDILSVGQGDKLEPEEL